MPASGLSSFESQLPFLFAAPVHAFNLLHNYVINKTQDLRANTHTDTTTCM